MGQDNQEQSSVPWKVLQQSQAQARLLQEGSFVAWEVAEAARAGAASGRDLTSHQFQPQDRVPKPGRPTLQPISTILPTPVPTA